MQAPDERMIDLDRADASAPAPVSTDSTKLESWLRHICSRFCNIAAVFGSIISITVRRVPAWVSALTEEPSSASV